MRCLILSVIPFFIIIAILTISDAQSAVFLVNPNGSGDYPTIQAAIQAVSTGDIIELGSGVFTGDGNRDLDLLGKAIIIRSQSGSPSSCVIDCQGSQSDPHRCFVFQNGESSGSRIEGLMVINGWHGDGGAITIADGSSPTIIDCVFANNNADAYGGAVYCYASATISNCRFKDNVAGNRGGGIFAGDGNGTDAEIMNCVFEGNSAADGGGVHCRGTVSITECSFFGNHALYGYAYGGGISCRYHTGTISRCTLVSNEALQAGGIAFYGDGPTVQQCIIAFSSNGGGLGWGYGGANSTPTISCSAIWGNVGGHADSLQAGMIDGGWIFYSNPCLCDVPAGDLQLCADSWCIPENRPASCGGIIGAYGVGCSACACPPPVESSPESWGTIKNLFK